MWKDAHAHVAKVKAARSRITRPPSPVSNFQPKVDLRTDLIKDYSKDFPEEFWETFPTNKVSSWTPESYFIPDELLKLAEEVKYQSMGNIEWMYKNILEGFSIGCRGTGRWPMLTSNHKTCLTYGPQLVDTMVGV